jgi:4-amino-4-deoxy-L-arabinose transferase-like glycosyltransferase
MRKHIPFIVGLLIVIFLSTYELTESPPTWMDEGIFSQVARNMALHGEHGMQVAPGEFENGIYITTSYTVTGPIALSFLMFGPGIFSARIVMVLFIIAGYCAFYVLIRRKLSGWPLILSLLLVAFFAPLYGHGRNVMGEVPGTVYFLLGLVFLMRIHGGKRDLREYVLAGLFAGIATVTKPIYVLIIPAMLIPLFVYRRELFDAKKNVAGYFVSAAIPFTLWFCIQFGGTSFDSIISLYANPNDIDVWVMMKENARRFFTELQPMYTLGLFGLWTISAIFRIKKDSLRGAISPKELAAWILSLLILVMYLRTAGYYRYFFVAELLAIIFVLPSVLSAVSSRFTKPILICFTLLVLFHAYQTLFSSWTSAHTDGNRAALLTKYVSTIADDKKIFFYQVPEAVNFLPASHTNYHQYIRINSALENGSGQVGLLDDGEMDVVLTNSELVQDPVFGKYKVETSFDRYVILVKK